jgi:hypothetical protein
MPIERVPLGMDAKLFRNITSDLLEAADFEGTNIAVCDNVKDLTLTLEKATADVTTRGNNGWRAEVGTLKSASVQFQMVVDPADAFYSAINAAYLNGTPIQFAVMSGSLTPLIPAKDSEGLLAVFSINSVTREEPLEGAQMASVTMTPTYTTPPAAPGDPDYSPSWLIAEAVAPPGP